MKGLWQQSRLQQASNRFGQGWEKYRHVTCRQRSHLLGSFTDCFSTDSLIARVFPNLYLSPKWILMLYGVYAVALKLGLPSMLPTFSTQDLGILPVHKTLSKGLPPHGLRITHPTLQPCTHQYLPRFQWAASTFECLKGGPYTLDSVG